MIRVEFLGRRMLMKLSACEIYVIFGITDRITAVHRNVKKRVAIVEVKKCIILFRTIFLCIV